MNIHTFSIPDGRLHDVAEWVCDNKMISRYSYTWPSPFISFDSDDDAIAFSLRFGFKKAKTKIECMIEQEELNESNH